MLSKSYLNHPAISQSQLKHILNGPAEFKWNKENSKRESTPSQLLGQAVHLLVLEPHKFYMIMKKPDIEPRTRKDKIFKLLEKGMHESYFKVTSKAAKKQQDGIFYEVDSEEWDFVQATREEYGKYLRDPDQFIVLNANDYVKCHEMSESFRRNEDAMSILSRCCEFEKEIYYTHNGIDFKAQLDGVGLDFVFDLKTTTAQNNDRDLANTIRNYLYHFQAYSYLQAAQVDKYYIGFIRSDAPYAVMPVQLSSDFLMEGQALFNEACDRYNNCLVFNPEFKEENKLRTI
jgi:hypothetical protein